jgi:hypothetical protein
VGERKGEGEEGWGGWCILLAVALTLALALAQALILTLVLVLVLVLGRVYLWNAKWATNMTERLIKAWIAM